MENRPIKDDKSITFPPCAGIIVFRETLKGTQTILVKTEKANYSFPKGKRHKKSGPLQRWLETDIEAAWRELNEETGLTKNDIQLIDNLYFDEQTKKGFASVRYFIGFLVSENNKLTFDTNELAAADWYFIDDILKCTSNSTSGLEKMKAVRKIILENAYKSYLQIMI